MSDLRTAAQQGLEALENLYLTLPPESVLAKSLNRRITALRAALEQPEQEPPRREWRGLTVEEIKACEQKSIVDGALPFERRDMFARAIEQLLKEKLEALNQELLEALKHAAWCVQNNYCPDETGHDWDDVIAKAEWQS